jgi:hypothetical protein
MKRIAQQTEHRARPARGGREAPAPWGGETGAAGNWEMALICHQKSGEETRNV